MIALVLVLSALQLIAGVRLLLLARRTRGSGLMWLAAAFIVSALAYALAWAVIGQIPSVQKWRVLVASVGQAATSLCILFFTHEAFYKGRTSPRWVLLLLTLAATAGVVWLDIQNRRLGAVASGQTAYQSWEIVMIGLANLFPWGWHLLAAWQGFRKIAPLAQVEDWLKGRYKLILAYSALLVLGSLVMLLGPWIGYNAANAVAGLTMILAIVPQFLAWVMPRGLRRFLNRRYRPPVSLAAGEELSEAELRKQLGE